MEFQFNRWTVLRATFMTLSFKNRLKPSLILGVEVSHPNLDYKINSATLVYVYQYMQLNLDNDYFLIVEF